MAKFNTSVRGQNKTVNHEGASAHKMSPELELYSAAVTTMLSNKFYESADERLSRIQELVKKVKPEFVAKLAVYAREYMHLRSLPLVLAVELAAVHKGDDLVSKVVNNIVQRPDEIMELLAFYEKKNGRTETKRLNKVSKQIQKGLAKAFNRFDEYGFSKYNRDGAIKLRDALFLVHPKADKPEQQVLFDKIAADTLAIPLTWETELSKGGDKKAAWEMLIDTDMLGYMAMLRNLRNILDANVSLDCIFKVADRLADPEAVAKSKQFPFRFYSAYREIEEHTNPHTATLLTALEDALIASAHNITGFDENTSVLIASDVSGSMQSPISERSKVEMYDVGLVLSMLLQHRSKNVVTGIFGDTWKIKNFPKTGILGNVSRMQDLADEVGMSTNGHLVIQDLIDRKEVVDKVMFFTDMQLWDSNPDEDFMWRSSTIGGQPLAKLWPAYKKIAPNAKLYLFDLEGNGTTPLTMHGNDVFLIAGWSEKIFDMLEAYENGSGAVEEINKIEL